MSNYIKAYCLRKFQGNYRISGDGTEIIIPSIFIEGDYKRHMSINLETGLWKCFKTSNQGNFIKLYSILEQCSYRRAYENFTFETILEDDKPEEPEVIEVLGPDDITTFDKLDLQKAPKNNTEQLAMSLVLSRMVKDYPFYTCTRGFYKDRLIIPYFKDNGEMYYFQARSLLSSVNPKYLNCKKIKSGNILYPYDYDSTKPLYITEGVFDCLSLKQCGFNATTTLSCNVSDAQMDQLRFYPGPFVVAFDQDEAGRKGTRRFISKAYKYKRDDLMYVLPSKTDFKDWNECLISHGENETRVTASKTAPLDFLSLILNEL